MRSLKVTRGVITHHFSRNRAKRRRKKQTIRQLQNAHVRFQNKRARMRNIVERMKKFCMLN